MPPAHPAIMNNLRRRYEELSVLHARDGRPESRQELEDVGRLLRVATGAPDIAAALSTARLRLPGPRSGLVGGRNAAP
ncbi:DUF5133 domain-containing protein [Streptomyces sp. LP05-1]|uniref:DUF5133 domain-containing protein n=1 Tax=Streptomyces pyxinae TaxID=2970734 RepID=A0ABT2CM19_9ACTN|nr:DUF5133 domain-containing protein [Streptomyces sp. LP05-1]MCS0638474.1 DUF5133 domain-containing protein [Streptomyces sp. LP05-1]